MWVLVLPSGSHQRQSWVDVSFQAQMCHAVNETAAWSFDTLDFSKAQLHFEAFFDYTHALIPLFCQPRLGHTALLHATLPPSMRDLFANNILCVRPQGLPASWFTYFDEANCQIVFQNRMHTFWLFACLKVFVIPCNWQCGRVWNELHSILPPNVWHFATLLSSLQLCWW